MLTRAEVAERLDVCPTTIYRWERAKISPVVPKRLKRSGQLRYTDQDVEVLRAWMNEVEDVPLDQPRTPAPQTAPTA